MCKFILIFVILLNILSPQVKAISAQSAILIDSKSGRVLFEHNPCEKLSMASTTKIMTGLLACESEKLNTSVRVSPFAAGTEGSSLWLKAGEVQSLENLTYGLMLKSGNDAAVAIAEHLAGSVDAFSLLMNEKARKIGAYNTHFENPHGLDAKEHYTTVYDLALIAQNAMKNKEFRKIVSTKTYSIPIEGEKWGRALKNHNKLLWRLEGCNGIKTGFTKKSGRCLVSSAKKGNEEYICVTLNAPDDWNDHTYLLNFGFDNFENMNVIKKGAVAKNVAYDEKHKRRVNVIYSQDFDIAVKKEDKITTEIKIDKIKYPAKKGSVAGYANIYCNGEEMGKIPLLLEKDIKKITFWEKIKFFFSKLKGRLFS